MTNHTNVKQDCAIFLFLDDMVLEDLVVQSLRLFHGRRHGVWMGDKLHQRSSQRSSTKETVLEYQEEQKGERHSARASIGLNEAQASQRQSRNKKLPVSADQ
jgi:hypothetical protein